MTLPLTVNEVAAARTAGAAGAAGPAVTGAPDAQASAPSASEAPEAAAKAESAAVAEAPAEPEPHRVLLHMPVDVRSMSLGVLMVLGVLFLLHWAKAVFIPLMLGIMFSYALSPPVDWLHRRRIPRAVGAGVLLLAIISGLVATGYSLSDDAAKLIASLPVAAQKVRNSVREMRVSRGRQDSTLETVQKAAAQIEQAAQETASNPAPASGPAITKVTIEKPRFDVKEYLWSGTIGLIALLGQATVVVFLTFFLLASGDSFRRKLVKIAGPSLTKKKVTVQALDEITEQVKRYLLVQLGTSVIVGLATWAAFAWIGMEQALVWGFAAGVLNLIPYVGAIAVTGGAALVAFLQFGTVNSALLVGGVSIALHIASGYLLTPWLTSRTSRMSPVVVFVAVLAWGWLWGVWGLLLGLPILMAIKAICDRVEDLKPIGELLGD